MLFDRGAPNPEPEEQGGPPDASGPSPDGIRNELDKILSNEIFRRAPQLSRLLRFVVEQEMSGHGAELKEYTLGVQVFRRAESFDPRVDNVARTEARRLRQRLAQYYETEGAKDLIEIGLPKGSYRPVFQSRVAAARPEPGPAALKRNRYPKMIAAGSLAAIAAAAVYWMPVRSSELTHSGRPPGIAVLPLENLSADPEQEYFSEGMTDALITDLTKIGGLRVISRTSVLRFKGSKTPIAEIAGKLGVEYVVEGTVTQSGERVRITAELIAVPNERRLWADSFERAGRDVLTLQGEIARAIASQINVHITPQEKVRLASRPINPEAHDLYLRGRFNWYTRNPERVRKSIQYFQEAIRIEPAYALAHVGLADAYSVLADQLDNSADTLALTARAHDEAAKAIALDETLGEAHVSLVMNELIWDGQKKEKEFRRALELSPNYATGHAWFGEILTPLGRFEEAQSEIRRALELDPLSPSMNMLLGWSLFVSRQYDPAIRQLRQTVEVFPDYRTPYALLGMSYLSKGMPREAVDVIQKLVKLSGGAARDIALLAHARAVGGDKSEARRVLAEFQKLNGVTPTVLIPLYLDLGDKDHAIECIRKAVDQHAPLINQLKVHPFYDSLHGDPRYTALLRQMNLLTDQNQ